MKDHILSVLFFLFEFVLYSYWVGLFIEKMIESGFKVPAFIAVNLLSFRLLQIILKELNN